MADKKTFEPNLGITVGTLLKLCIEEVKKGNQDKHILISADDEGNGFHTLFYGFTSAPDEVEPLLELEHDGTHNKDNAVILG